MTRAAGADPGAVEQAGVEPASLPSPTAAARVRVRPRELMSTARSCLEPRVVWINPAWLSVLAATVLAIMGLLAIRVTEDPEQWRYFTRQATFLGAGLFACGVTAAIRPTWWRHWSYPMAIASVALLVFVLIPFLPHEIVRPRNGARRWINLGIADFQPSELAKIAFVLALAHYLRWRKNYRTLKGLLVPFAIMFVPMGLVLVEPDLGTAMLFPPVLFAMLLAAGCKIRHLLVIGGLGAGSALLIAFLSLAAAAQDPPRYPLLEKHQVERIQALVNQIEGDRRQADSINFQGFKAMTIVGAGGATGLGEERSRVIVSFNKLPEDHNDMIFAVVNNRWGFIGGTAMMGLYLLYCLGLTLTAATTQSPFARLTCVGFAACVACQAIVNMGMTIGLLPITGMTLPFVSYGGSSLVANLAMTGIALGMALRPPALPMRRSFEFDEPDDDVDPLHRVWSVRRR